MSDTSPPFAPPSAEFYAPIPVRVTQAPRRRYWLHVLLLLATCFTTLVVGARMQFNFIHNQPVFSLDDSSSLFPVSWTFSHPSRLLLGAPFAGTLMLILLAHEMGHYLYCRHYGVWATLPFFITAPTLIGTFGAFIRIRSPIRSRTALFDIGIAGPIAGFVVAFCVLVVSLGLSRPAPVWPALFDLELNYPLIFRLTHHLVAMFSPAHSAARMPLNRVLLHPTAVAAWVGMFATSLNLLPGGQLDGGHIVFSIAPRAHRFVSRLTILVLLPLAYYRWAGWIVWAVLLQLSSLRHPQVADWPKISGVRAWLALSALVMLVLTLTPAPFAHASLREVLMQLWDSMVPMLRHLLHR
jgi:membrane-associated protease RseP (regulator of RpoE activity)